MPCKWRSHGETPSRDKKGVAPFLFQQDAPWNMRSPTATDLLCATYQWTHQQFGVSRWTVVNVLRSCFLLHWGRRQGIHLVSSTGFHEISANFYSREIFIIWPIVKWRYQNGSRQPRKIKACVLRIYKQYGRRVMWYLCSVVGGPDLNYISKCDA